MTDSSDRLFAEAAVSQGFLSARTIEQEEAARLREAPAVPLSEWLVRRGVLAPEQATRLAEDRKRISFAHTILDGEPSTADGAPSAVARTVAGGNVTVPGFALGRVGKYELLEELGRGGMGVVYRARDIELGREVALKTALLGGSQGNEIIERLLREARTAATLDHPSIIPIHDVGVHEGVPFFAMAYVRGTPLDRVLHGEPPPDLRERARLVCEVARAVAHAHQRRVVHRDLKPSNVIVDAERRVHVMDFGLAKRLDEGARLTTTGQMIGTPQYMPPEQIEGEIDRIGPASDVYALGAMLYEALTGQPPFSGATLAEVVMKALAHDPEPPRKLDPRVHPDLETICLRALEKEPERRYPDAGRLTADLERWLAGEEIEARRSLWSSVIARRVRRHKARSALAVAAGLLAAWAGWTAWSGARLEDKVRADLRDKARMYLDAALDLRRSGRSTRSLAQEVFPKLARAVDEAERLDPGRGEPAYLLGRMASALMRFDEARAAQERALAKEPQYAPSLYEHAILTARRQADRFRLLRAQALQAEGARLAKGGGEARASVEVPTIEDLETADAEAQTLRKRLRADLDALEHAASTEGGVSLPPERLACARALALACGSTRREDLAQAREKLKAALQADPRLTEAIVGWAAICEALEDWDGAVEAYTRGAETDRGFLPFWIGRGVARLTQGFARSGRGEDPLALYAAAESDFRTAAEIDPEDADPWAQIGQLDTKWAGWLGEHGQDAEERFAQGAKSLDRAVELAPGSVEILQIRGGLSVNWAVRRKDQGADPRELFEKALSDFRHIVEVDPTSAPAWMGCGAAHGNQGYYAEHHGGEPDSLYALAVEDYGKAIERNPRLFAGWIGRGQVRTNWASVMGRRSQDADSLYEQAIADYRQAVTLMPASAEPWVELGEANMNRGLHHLRKSQDPEVDYGRSETNFRRALELNPHSAFVWSSLGLLQSNWGCFLLDKGQDPSEIFARALESLGKALALNPSATDAWLRRGALRGNWARWLDAHGPPSDEIFTQSIEDFRKAQALTPDLAEAWQCCGQILIMWGVRRATRGADPASQYDGAITALQEATRLNPTSEEAWLRLGEAQSISGFRHKHLDEDPAPCFLGAMTSLKRAKELNPVDAEPHWRTGHLYVAMELYTQAVEEYNEAVRLDPKAEEAEKELRPKAEMEAHRIEGLPAELRVLQTAGDDLKLGEYTRSRAGYREYLRLASELQPKLSGADSQRLFPVKYRVHAHFNLACVAAVLSTGRAYPTAEPKALPDPTSRALRDESFANLEDAIGLSDVTRKSVETDPDLVRLKDDPRWAPLLERLR